MAAKTAAKKTVVNPDAPEVEVEKVVATKEVKNSDGMVLSKKARAMKAALDKQDKVELYIPRDSKEKQGTVQTITLNGYPFHIMKGARVKVPAQVADVYYESVASQDKAVQDAMERADKLEQ